MNYKVCNVISNAMHVKGVKRSSKYTTRVIMLFLMLSMSKVFERNSKYKKNEAIVSFYVHTDDTIKLYYGF